MERANAVAAAMAQKEREMAEHGRKHAYADWLQPLVSANRLEMSTVETSSADASAGSPVPARRGRGRPRVTKPRDPSAIEKRRAQVREAQRTYQKRKDGAAETERKRCDEVLEVMSDLSTDIEALLQAVSETGLMDQQCELASHMRRLWSSYDTAINSPCVKPELRLLQVKNDRRKAEHQTNGAHRKDATMGSQTGGITHPTGNAAEHTNIDIGSSQADMESTSVENESFLQPFPIVHSAGAFMRGRNLFEVMNERSTQFRNQLKLQEQISASLVP